MNGAERILNERQRQITQEGWAPEHDDEHLLGQLMQAGMSYLSIAQAQVIATVSGIEFDAENYPPPMLWPWAPGRWKPSDDVLKNLTRAGALIAAEMDRIDRAAAPAAAPEGPTHAFEGYDANPTICRHCGAIKPAPCYRI